MKTLKQKVRDAVVGRNTLARMGEGVHYRNEKGMKYLNGLAAEVMIEAGKTHKYLPYYLAIRTI